ncbi:MAG: hypothetical protein B9S27_02595 [Opitutia bacterium Tous-C8FEB]|nr:MAG: hypothetical protein B9S27_02595 [Opitutae bacterium Tous-C8FEB]
MNPQPSRRTGFGLWDSHRQVARRQQRLRDEAEQAPPGPDEDPGLPPPDPDGWLPSTWRREERPLAA